MDEPAGFRDFVASRSPALVRSAYLLTGDRGEAEDLVQTALVKTWSRWSRIVRRDAPEAYVRRVMVSTFLSWRRRRSRSERPLAVVPDGGDSRDLYAEADVRSAVRTALDSLPARQRAVIVLRYFDDLTEVQVAALMGCSVGTVKSQNAKAIAKLRAGDALSGLLEKEVGR